MWQTWINAALILLGILSLVQCNDVTDNACAHAPKLVNQVLDVISNFSYLLIQDDNADNESRRCCDIYGCFSSEVAFEDEKCRMKVRLPFCQDKLQIKFYLWTNETGPDYEVIDPENEETLLQSKMIQNSSVFIYINGFLGDGNMPYISMIKDALLEKDPGINFISVEWVNGSRLPYMRSLANTKMVGAVTAHLIQQLQKNFDIRPEEIHIVGTNIGAHAAGEVGKRIPGIGRITGLDPSGWELQYCPEMLGLSMTDAKFVDVIHTNAKNFGTPHPRGHLDIYINGALDQPACMGCPGCDHTIAILYYLETIKNEELPYRAYQCDSYENFLKGKCDKGCGRFGSHCANMGYKTHKWLQYAAGRMSPTIMFMSMGTDENHYHLYHYYVKINCMNDKPRLWRYGRYLDKLEINLIDGNRTSGYKEIYANAIAQTTMANITAIITSKEKFRRLSGIGIKWTPQADKQIPETCEMSNSMNGAITELEKNCLECPFQLKSILIRNLETRHGIYFLDINQKLIPNEEFILNCYK